MWRRKNSPEKDIKQIHLFYFYYSFLEYNNSNSQQRVEPMDINSLTAFLAVAETGSFSLAAEQLHLTQPAVSKRIALLERDLGTRLFDRIGRKVTLTEAGLQLRPRARHLYLEVADIQREITNLSGQVRGTLVMGTSHHIGLRRLPPILKQYSRLYPDVALDIRFMGSESACAAVEHGELELAIVTLPTRVPDNLRTETIWGDPLRFVVSPDHPLGRKAKPSLQDLFNYPAVLTTSGTYTRQVMEQAMQPYGINPKVGMATDYLETLKMMVTIGLGWGLLPDTMIQDGQLRILSFEGLNLSRNLGVVIHRDRTPSNASRAMQEICLARESNS
jgi:DNA-binding transcriptional LysR family regulator